VENNFSLKKSIGIGCFISFLGAIQCTIIISGEDESRLDVFNPLTARYRSVLPSRTGTPRKPWTFTDVRKVGSESVKHLSNLPWEVGAQLDDPTQISFLQLAKNRQKMIDEKRQRDIYYEIFCRFHGRTCVLCNITTEEELLIQQAINRIVCQRKSREEGNISRALEDKAKIEKRKDSRLKTEQNLLALEKQDKAERAIIDKRTSSSRGCFCQ